tara:strand:- start:142 stop:915 length:774 start_codon:yes stop_codon:yes gene_type:complete
MVKLNLKIIAMSIVLIAILKTEKLSAQNFKNLFGEHHKWGLVGQYNTFSAANITPTNNKYLRYEIFNSKMFAVGIAYNIHQYKKWNFKAELQIQWFGDYEGKTILEPENETSQNIGAFSRTEHDKLGYLPLTAEYMYAKSGSFSFTIGGGLGLTYYEPYNITQRLSINNVELFFVNYKTSNSSFYFSNHIQASVYFKRKNIMIQTSLIYKKSYTSFRTGIYEFKNLELSPDLKGSINQSGDFLGLSLTIYPKKNKRK